MSSRTKVSSFEEWLTTVPKAITEDALWKIRAYQLALFLADLSWHDVTKLAEDQRTVRVSDQLYRANGSVGANIAEGYSRGSGKAKAQFYEYSLGSAREARHWYHQSKHVLGQEVVAHRHKILAEICRLLITMIPHQRNQTLREEPADYHTDHSEDLLDDNSLSFPDKIPDLLITHYSFAKPNLTIDPRQAPTLESTLESTVVPRRGDAVMVAGEGCWLIDADSNRYLDLTAGQGVAMLGYGHPALTKAIAEQAQRLHVCPNFFYNDVRAAFLQKLIEVTPGHLTRAFLANSGAEANDGALKFARLATGRAKIVSTKQGFHGRTVGSLSVTWDPKYRQKFEPLLPGVTHVSYNSLDEIDATVDEETAAVILEVIQGEGGVNEGTAAFLEGTQRICRERGALLIVDEIQTGFRTGKWFAHQHFDLQPDIVTLAKGMAGGFPMGAIVYTDRVQEALFSGAHGSTFGGNPLACAAGLATLTTYQDAELIERGDRMGMLLRRQLEEAIGNCRIVREIRGKGLMIGIDLRTRVVPFLKTLMEEHQILALPAGSTVLRLLPPLIISEEEIERAVDAIAAVLPQ